jgi:hypothetical protein
MNDLVILIFGILLALGASLLIVFCLRFVFGYRLDGQKINILFFRMFALYSIPIATIKIIKIAGWKELGVGGATLRLGNRFTSRCVLIEKDDGIFRRVVITPTDPENFVGRVHLLQRK